MMLIRHLVGTIAALATCVLVAGFAATALVMLSPGYGVDEAQLDPRYSASVTEAAPDRNAGRMYWTYLVSLTRGDLGTSSSFNEPVSALLSDRVWVTSRNVCLGLLFAWASAVGMSICGLLPGGRRLRPAALATGSFMLCIPSTLVALAAVLLDISVAPAIGAIVFPRLHRYMDNVLQSYSRRTYVLAAGARGVHLWRLIASHVMRPALPEVAALAGISINIALGASIPIEVLSDNAGIGQLAWRGALSRDVQLVTGATLFISLVTVSANRLSTLVVTLAKRPA